MTAIVANHEMVVSDSACSNGTTKFDTPKITVIKGCIVAGSGHQKPFELFCEAFERAVSRRGVKTLPKPDLGEGAQFDALVLLPDGRLFTYDDDFAALEVTSGHYAIGCGQGPVMAVLAHIKRKGGVINEEAMRDAVTAAADVIDGVGLPIQITKLSDIKPTRRKRK